MKRIGNKVCSKGKERGFAKWTEKGCTNLKLCAGMQDFVQSVKAEKTHWQLNDLNKEQNVFYKGFIVMKISCFEGLIQIKNQLQGFPLHCFPGTMAPVLFAMIS